MEAVLCRSSSTMEVLMISTNLDDQPIEETPDLIPARMLNEFSYCPRLAYLEWVQGEFADNLETLEGRFAHRRVDRPSRRNLLGPADAPGFDPNRTEADSDDDEQDRELADPSETIHSRSLMLSSPVEGLIAKMDLVDINAGAAIPVDYKRGQVPDVPDQAWEPERVQLCAQGLVLRANGYQCEGGILYFVESRRRVSVAFDDALVDRTRQLIAEMRSAGASGVIPPPLDNSPKCPRCSLVGICLPDETRLLSQPAGGANALDGEIRRLTPARDNALPLYLQEQGTTLGKSGETLTIKSRQKVLQEVRLLDVSQVSVFGNVQITAQALREITAAGIPVCHFSYGGWFHAMTSGLIHKNVELRIAQYAAAADPGRSLELARQFVVGKIKNCRTLLRRHLGAAAPLLDPLHDLIEKSTKADNVATLLGLEGMAAKAYFSGFAKLLQGGETFHIDGRNRRPPRDPINALLSFVYAILVKEITLALHAVGFDPMRGFYHTPRYGRPSLALDVTEEFRPLVADSVVLTLVNNGEVSPASFIHRAGAVALTTAGRRAVLAAFERRMDTLVTHPIFGYRASYRRILEVQARLLGRVLLGEIAEYPSFCTR
jgi:CRISPR-associated protein Cas1